MLVAVMFGRANCKLCKEAEEKLIWVRVDYMKVDIAMCMLTGWPALPVVADEVLQEAPRGMLVEVMVNYQVRETLPWIVLYETKDGKWSVQDYPGAMKILRDAGFTGRKIGSFGDKKGVLGAESGGQNMLF